MITGGLQNLDGLGVRLFGSGASIPTANLQLWLKADAIGGVSNGSGLATWPDSSGNANNASSAGGAQPVYNTGQINGLPAVTFNGSSNWMNISSIASSSGTGHTCFVVFKLAGSSKGQVFSGALQSFGYWFTNVQGLDSTQSVNVGSAGTNLGTTWHQANCLFTPGSIITFRLDRALDASGSTGYSGVTGSNNVVGRNGFSGSELFNGQLAELIYYTASLSGSDTTTVENYLHAKYGL